MARVYPVGVTTMPERESQRKGWTKPVAPPGPDTLRPTGPPKVGAAKDREDLILSLVHLLAEKDAEIERLREALTFIANSDGVDNALDPHRNVRVAVAALGGVPAARRDEAAIREDEREKIAREVEASIHDGLAEAFTLAACIRAGGTPQEDR